MELRGFWEACPAITENPIVKELSRPDLKIVKDVNGVPVISAPTVEYEPFNPNPPAQIVEALALHGIEVENAQKETLAKIDSPETRLLLDYAKHKTLLSHIDGILRSTFADGRNNGPCTKEPLLPAYEVIGQGFDAVFRQFYGDRLAVKVEGYAGRSRANY